MKTFSIYLLGSMFLLTALFLNSCGSSQSMALNSVQLTNQLQPGMTYDEVVAILGSPKSSKTINTDWIVRWNLQEMWKGYVPYDFVFSARDKTLISWSENSEAYAQSQEQLKTIADEVEKQSVATQGSGEAVPMFENDQALMQSFAGYYYSFSAVGGGQTGGTERKVMLCPDGRYQMNSESGYSGGDWGSASQGGGDGTWRITGNMNAGTLVTTGNNGSSTAYKFERCASDCVYFGNTKFGLAGPANCK
jgi:ABC-type glycerol-3-phosphate transport system substrate-binding protein